MLLIDKRRLPKNIFIVTNTDKTKRVEKNSRMYKLSLLYLLNGLGEHPIVYRQIGYTYACSIPFIFHLSLLYYIVSHKGVLLHCTITFFLYYYYYIIVTSNNIYCCVSAMQLEPLPFYGNNNETQNMAEPISWLYRVVHQVYNIVVSSGSRRMSIVSYYNI